MTRDNNDRKDPILPETSILGPQPVFAGQSQSLVTSDQPSTSESMAGTDTREEMLSSDSIWDIPDTPQFRKP